jgi:glycosyltransferase 2 family protein
MLGGEAIFGSLRYIAPSMFATLGGLAIISGIAKAGKLQILLISLGRQLSFWHTLAITFVTDFAFLSSPAGAAGYAVNMGLLRNRNMSWSLAATVVGAEQTLDLAFFSVAMPVAIISAWGAVADELPKLPIAIQIALSAATVLLVLGLWWGRHLLAKVLRSLAASIPWLRTRRSSIAGFISELRSQITILMGGSARRNVALLLLTAIQWLTRYGVLWLVLKALGHAVPFGLVLAIQCVVLHLALWTGIPAGGGSADLGLAAALTPWVSRPIIATALLLWRFSTLYFPLALGALSLLILACRAGSLDILKVFRSRH